MDCTRRPTGGALRPGQLAWLNHTGESDDDRLSLLLQLSTIEPPLTYTTRSHDVVRRWARERGAQPALRRETSAGVVTHRLAFAFRADEEEHSLRRIAWHDWLRAFDASQLTFGYSTHRHDGALSRFFRLTPADLLAEST